MLRLSTFYIIIVVIYLPISLFSQQDSARFTSITSVNLSLAQSSVSDWKDGEKNTINIKANCYTNIYFLTDFFKATMALKLNIGVQKESSELFPDGFYRSSDNELFNEIKFIAPIGWDIDPFLAVGIRTQLTESHLLAKNGLMRTAKFWDPIISSESLGFTVSDVNKIGSANIRLGIVLQQIRSHFHTDQTDNPTTLNIREAYKPTSGIELVGETRLTLDSNIIFNGRMSLHSTFKDLDVWSVLSENEIRIRIWKFIGFIIMANIAYNREQSLKTQFRQSTMLSLIHDL